MRYLYIACYLIFAGCGLHALDLEHVADLGVGASFDSPDGMVAGDGLIYANTHYGLQIFQPDALGRLTRISRTPLRGQGYRIIRNNRILYLVTSMESSSTRRFVLYRIDVSSPGHPVVTDSLFSEDNGIIWLCGFRQNLLIIENTPADAESTRVELRDPATLGLIAGANVINDIHVVNDSIFTVVSSVLPNGVDFFRFTGSGAIHRVGSVDMSRLPSGWCTRFESLGDSTLVNINSLQITIFRHHAFAEFDSLASIRPMGGNPYSYQLTNERLYFPGERFGLEVFDLSDPLHPIRRSSTNPPDSALFPSGNLMPWQCTLSWPYFYIGSMDKGVYRYLAETGEYVGHESPGPYYQGLMPCPAVLCGTCMIQGSFSDGILIFDLDHPEDPEPVAHILPKTAILTLSAQNNRLIALYCPDRESLAESSYRAAVFDVTNPTAPSFLWETTPTRPLYFVWQDSLEPGAFYGWGGTSLESGAIVKYDLLPGIPMRWEFPFPHIPVVGFADSILFTTEQHGSNRSDLLMYSGFRTDAPYLVDRIDDLGKGYEAGARLQSSYLLVFRHNANDTELSCRIYSAADPLHPQLLHEIPDAGCNLFPLVVNDYVFVSYWGQLAFYDLTVSEDEPHSPDGFLWTSSPPVSGLLLRYGDQNFLAVTEFECISLYRLDISSTGAGVEHRKAIISYPNPFSGNVQIRMSNPRSQRVCIEVYDVRGRLVCHVFDGKAPPGEHSVSWNGNDDSGRPAASGIYLVRLSRSSAVEYLKVTLLR
jgi:hypothetical protein